VILDASEERIVSSVGWVERGALLVWDTESNETRLVPVDDSDYLVLIAGDDDYFAVVHQRQGGGYMVSVRHMTAPESALARVRVTGSEGRFEGDGALWRRVPRAYGGYDPSERSDPDAPYTLLLLEASGPACEVQRMRWFNAETYDLLYQGMLTPVDVPGQPLVLIPIQRDSRPVIYDIHKRDVVDRIQLADRGGNPTLLFRTPEELWADDYDTILRLDTRWVKRGERHLQDPDQGIRQFIGDWSFSPDRSLCVIGRPFSGDVVGLDTATLAVTRRAKLGDQPLAGVALSDGRVFARDWQSGRPLTGRFQAVEPDSV
jgi:hypothetical protein